MDEKDDEDRPGYPTLLQLEAFVAAAQSGSYPQAAAMVGQQPAPLWRMVSRLEDKLRLQLLEGGKGGLRTTPAGAALIPAARNVLDAARVFLRDVEGARGGRLQVIRLGCYPAHVAQVVAPAMRAIATRWPDIQIRLPHVADEDRAEGGLHLFEALRSREVDVIIAPVREVNEEALLRRDLYSWSLVVVFPDNVVPDREQVGYEELLAERLLVSPPDSTSRRMLDGLFAVSGSTPPIAHESISTEALLALVEHRHGVAVIPDDAVPKEWEPHCRRLIDTNGAPLSGEYSVYAPRALCEEGSPMLSFINELQAAASSRSSSQARKKGDLPEARRN